jgi:hypothetical protein
MYHCHIPLEIIALPSLASAKIDDDCDKLQKKMEERGNGCEQVISQFIYSSIGQTDARVL